MGLTEGYMLTQISCKRPHFFILEAKIRLKDHC